VHQHTRARADIGYDQGWKRKRWGMPWRVLRSLGRGGQSRCVEEVMGQEDGDKTDGVTGRGEV
jgi:hypothetical protein